MTDLLAIGGAHLDKTARLVAPHIAGASNPVRMHERIGGGAFNALRVARFCGLEQCAMMSVRGGDGASQAIEAAIDRARIADFSGSFMDHPSPSYTAVLEPNGELVTALADMALYDYGFDRQVRRAEGRARISAAKALLVDANLPASAFQSACAHAKGRIYAMAISPAKVERILESAERIDILFLNMREVNALPDSLEALGIKCAVISNGAEEVHVYENGLFSTLRVPAVNAVKDVTGAGDALTGGTIAALMGSPHLPLTDCVTNGIAAAQLALQVDGPLCEPINQAEFDAAVRRVKAIN